MNVKPIEPSGRTSGEASTIVPISDEPPPNDVDAYTPLEQFARRREGALPAAQCRADSSGQRCPPPPAGAALPPVLGRARQRIAIRPRTSIRCRRLAASTRCALTICSSSCVPSRSSADAVRSDGELAGSHRSQIALQLVRELFGGPELDHRRDALQRVEEPKESRRRRGADSRAGRRTPRAPAARPGPP